MNISSGEVRCACATERSEEVGWAATTIHADSIV